MSFKDDILLVYFPIPAPPDIMAEFNSKFPELTVRWIETPIVNNGLVPPEKHLTPEQWEGITMTCLYHVWPPELAPRVRFVQSSSAGNDFWAGHPAYENPEIMFCNSTGCSPPQLAEWVMGTWLQHTHHFLTYAEQQREGVWVPQFEPVLISTRRRMGILGYGGIGRQCARLAQAFGMDVYAYTHRERPTPESRRDTDAYTIPGTGDADGLIPSRWFSGASREAINDFLSQDLDLLVICLPLNDATRGLIGAEQLRILGRNARGRGTFVCNVARGAIVDTDALIAALHEGVIPGAAVDVTDPEPLTKGHPLWKAPNIFITPHVAWQSDRFWLNLAGLLVENLERLATGKELLNLDGRK